MLHTELEVSRLSPYFRVTFRAGLGPAKNVVLSPLALPPLPTIGFNDLVNVSTLFPKSRLTAKNIVAEKRISDNRREYYSTTTFWLFHKTYDRRLYLV